MKRLRSNKRLVQHSSPKPPQPRSPEDPRLTLLWFKPLRSSLSALSLNLMREICSFLSPSAHIVDVGCDYIRYFDVCARKWRPFVRLSCFIPGVKYTARWLVLADGRTMYTGGQDTGKGLLRGTYAVESTGQVRAEALMLQGRAYHGFVQWKQRLMVFGGGCHPVECESLQFSRLQPWEPLPAMPHGHTFCSTCLYRDIIYLCGYTYRAIDAFSPTQNRFKTITTLAPANVFYIYVDQNELAFHAAESVAKYDAREAGGLVQTSWRRA